MQKPRLSLWILQKTKNSYYKEFHSTKRCVYLKTTKTATEKIEYVIRILAFALPLVFLFGTHVIICKIDYIGFITIPRLYAWVLTALVICDFIFKKKVELNLGRSFRCALGLLIMMAYSFISLLWAVDFNISIYYFTYQLAGCLSACMVAYSCRSIKDLRVFLRILTVCYIAVAILGIVEIYTGVYLFSPSDYAFKLKSIYGLNLPYTVFYNTNDFASFLAVFAPFAVFTVFDWLRGVKGKIGAFVVSFLCFYNLLCGRARNCLITTVCFAVAVIIICLAVKRLRRFTLNSFICAAAMPLSYLVIKLTQASNGTLVEKIASVVQNDHSVNERFDIMLGGIQMAKAHHFMGVGVGNSPLLMPLYSDLTPINLHNMPLQIFVEYGIIIFAVYLGMTILIAKEFITFKTADDRIKLFCIIAFLSVPAFFIEGMQSSDAMHIYSLYMIFAIWFASIKVLYKNNVKSLPTPSQIFRRLAGNDRSFKE